MRAYEEAGIGPDDLDCAEVYDLSTAMELDWYEQIGLCAPGEAEKLLRDGETTIGGRIPVNPSGGLACFGEAVPAQAIAQVCELTWQIQGRADGPPGRGRARRPDDQPRPLRPRLRRHRLQLTSPNRRESAARMPSLTPVRVVGGWSACRARPARASSWTASGALATEPLSNGRLRVVLDAELDRLRDLVAGDVRGERQRHVDARRHAGRGDDLALLDDPLATRVSRRTRAAGRATPSAWSPPCPRAARPRRAAASRCTPTSSTCCPRRSRGSTRASARRRTSGARADAAGHDEDVGARDLVERVVGDEPEHALLGAHRPALGGDEPHLARRAAAATPRRGRSRRAR